MTKITKDGEYTTRSGLPVRIYAVDGWTGYPVHGAYFHEGMWVSSSWQAEGDYCGMWGGLSAYDLIPKPRMVAVDCWLNVYRNGTFSVYETRSVADGMAVPRDRIACAHIIRQVEEGEGL